MVVFRYEWKRNQKYILTWAAVLAACIFFMTPVYYEILGNPEKLPAGFAQGGLLETLGITLDLLREPLGMYGFLTGFLTNAGGIFGMHFGLSLHTGECTGCTAEYLFTKPCGRKAIYRAKALCMVCGVWVAGAFYLAASLLTMGLFYSGFSLWELSLLALSLPLTALFFGALGLWAGSRWPRNHSPLMTAGLTTLSMYGITAFSRTVDNRLIGFLSPLSFFGAADIHALGFYAWDYLVWYLLLVTLFFVLAYRVLMKRDVTFVR